MRLLIIASLCAIAKGLNSLIPYYVIYGIFVIYAIIFAIKHRFANKVLGRVMFVLG